MHYRMNIAGYTEYWDNDQNFLSHNGTLGPRASIYPRYSRLMDLCSLDVFILIE
jgi:hypothetical protein